ncbi:peptidoglycan-binding protein [Oryzibacter oryziterrae]|uniref:peptidoglycan-binding protein n=1 Tax=Oryzibacter oryziterrae TaxID=2766474 RepID=UPI001F34D164|nr:peptidoglycan-binding protein [Oryzibacter oryziterrae]
MSRTDGGTYGSTQRDADYTAARAGQTVDDWLSATGPSHRGAPPRRSEDESVSKILSSLDRLGERIRMLTPAAGEAPAPRASASDELQRAIEQISRKRDALERGSVDRATPSSRFREDVADLGARVQALSRPESPSFREEAPRRRYAEPAPSQATDYGSQPLQGLQRDVGELKAMLSDLAARNSPRLLEAGFASLVDRLDSIRPLVDNQRSFGDLVQQLADIRRLFDTIPTDAHVNAIAARLEDLSELVHRGGDGRAMLELNRRIGDLAGAVATLDQRETISAISSHLADVSRQIQSLEQRFAGLDSLDRWGEVASRQTALMGQIAQRAEQLPRFAHELERQSTAVEQLARVTDGLPRLARDMDAVQHALGQDRDRTLAGFDKLIARMDELGARIETADGPRLDGLEDKLAEILSRLDRIDTPLDQASLKQLETHLGRLAQSVDSSLTASVPPQAEDLMGALARIESHLSSSASGNRFTELEHRVESLTRSLSEIDFATTKDLAAVDRAIDALRGEVTTLSTQTVDRVEQELRLITDRIGEMRLPQFDAHAIIRIEQRLSDVVAKLESRPAEVFALANALEKLEATMAVSLAGNAQAGASYAASGSDREAVALLAAVEGNISRLSEDLRGDAKRDRELLLTICEAVERLATRELAARRNTMFDEPVEPAAAPVAEPEDRDNGTWQEIEKALTGKLQRPAAAPAADDEDMPRIFGRKAKAPKPRQEPPLAATPDEDAAPGPFDVNLPLEPGSGKPRVARPTGEKPARAPQADAKDAAATPSKADFIAAARRAALAAGTAEPGQAPHVAMAQPAEGGKSSRLLDVLKAHGRKIGIGAVALLVLAGGTRLAVQFLEHRSDTQSVAQETSVPAEPAPVEPASADASAQNASGDTSVAAAPPSDTPAPVAAAPEAKDASAAASSDLSGMPSVTASTGFGAKATDLPANSFAPVASPSGAETSPSTTALVPPQTMTAPPVTEAAPPVATAMAPVKADLPPSAVGPMALRQAAADGNPRAQMEVASRYADGKGVPADLKTAATWYHHAADGGLAVAQYRLGSLFEKGEGVVRDPKQAAVWYGKAAAQGNAKAMHNLAVLNAEGGLGAPDYQMAAKWFQQAADLGVRDSQFNLGILYARGLGLPRDLTSSYKWFAIAANGGDADAAKKRDDVALALSKDDLARARLAVETWTAKPVDPAANDDGPLDPAWTAAPGSTASIDQTRLIAKIQNVLTAHGFDVGPADGKMGKKTKDAIAAFQKSKGLPATGEIDAALITAITAQPI